MLLLGNSSEKMEAGKLLILFDQKNFKKSLKKMAKMSMRLADKLLIWRAHVSRYLSIVGRDRRL